MRLKAVALCPFGIAAGSCIKMAGFWFDNAVVAFSEFSKAGVTIALAKTLLGFSVAMYTKYLTGMLKGYWFTNQVIQGLQCISQRELIGYWACQFGP